MTRKALGLIVALVVFAVVPAAAARQAAPSGAWVSVTVRDGPQSTAACRYLVVETRTLNLQRGLNARVQGHYGRATMMFWLGAPPTCVLNGQPDLPAPRSHVWTAFGSEGADGRLDLRLVAPSCSGACDDAPPAVDQFEAQFTRPREELLVEHDAREGVRRYTAEVEAQRREGEAAAALRDLMQPLLDGACNAFVARSMHPDARWASPDQFCALAQSVGQLLAPTLYDQPGIALQVSRGRLFRPMVHQFFGDRDVLVCRFFVLRSDGQGAQVCAVLREAEPGRWLFVAFA